MRRSIIREIVGKCPKKLTIPEAAWLAGVIDGEGSIGLYDYGKEGRRVLIQMANTNKEFVKKMSDIIGCGSSVYRFRFHGSHKGRKPMYHYALKGSARCYVVLKQIVPFLIIKKALAEKIIIEIENTPFGRWKNATKEARQRQSLMAQASWANPVHRMNRIKGIKKHFAEVKS
jgi:hypothetical protein